MSLQFQAVKTKIFSAGENLADFIVAQMPRKLVQEKMILAVTSKIVSLAENRLVTRNSIEKLALIKREADVFVGEIGYGTMLTIKEGLLIPTSGIDESNSENGDYILYPQDPFASAHKLYQDLRKRWDLKELGILLTDSRSSPLRQGVTGVCLAYWGFTAVKDLIGTEDLFGRELKMTKINYGDALSATSVMIMGEGQEQQPLSVIFGADCQFADEGDPGQLRMPLESDMYAPLIQSFIEQSKIPKK